MNSNRDQWQNQYRNILNIILFCQFIVCLIFYYTPQQQIMKAIQPKNNHPPKSIQLQQQYQNNLNLTYEKQKIDDFKPDIRNIYNIQNMGKVFGKSKQFQIDIKQNRLVYDIYPPSIQRTIAGYTLDHYGFKDAIQVGSKLDYSFITQTVNFWELEKQLRDSFAYQLLQFTHDPELETPQQKIQLKTIISQDKLRQYLKSNIQNKSYSEQQQTNEFKLSLILANNEIKNKVETLQSQYFYSDLKYKIGKNNIQAPICIFTAEYNLYSKDQYHLYFESLQKLNYTNFHIVYVDDFSGDNSAYRIYQYLNKSNSRIKNRIKIVHNLQRLGAIGNMCFWIKKYCGENDIVVNIDGDDALLGRQAFQILNEAYRNQDIWYVYSKYAVYNPTTKDITSGYASKYLRFNTSHYRLSYDWITSHIRTFRQKLWNSIPIYSFIQYHVDNQTGLGWPRFYTSTADMLQIFALVESAGNKRVRFIDDYLYFYLGSAEGTARNCYRQHQLADQAKTRIKTPLKALSNLNQKGSMLKYYEIEPQIIDFAKRVYQMRTNCLLQISLK